MASRFIKIRLDDDRQTFTYHGIIAINVTLLAH